MPSSRESARLDHKADGRSFLAVDVHRGEFGEADDLHTFLVEMGATIVHGPEEANWAPGSYSVLFEDPDGIRLEMNHVPGKGLFAKPE